jgi:hypothetical protein
VKPVHIADLAESSIQIYSEAQRKR